MHVVILLSFLSPPLLFWGIDDILCKKKKKRGWSVRFSFPPFKKKEGRKRRKIGHRRRRAKKRGNENVGKNRMCLIVLKKKVIGSVHLPRVLFTFFLQAPSWRPLLDKMVLFSRPRRGGNRYLATLPMPSIHFGCVRTRISPRKIHFPTGAFTFPSPGEGSEKMHPTPHLSPPPQKTPTPFFYYPRNLRDKWTLRRGEGGEKSTLSPRRST